ncbi:MAG: radical SAM protein [Eubacteriales bacterium]|nr:radical SAM protein [Eubacteriales bacterium]
MITGKIRRYYKENFGEILQTTFNPNGPGSIRIHLIPPKAGDKTQSSLIMVNGRDILPCNEYWTVMLAEFIKEVNAFDGIPVTDEILDGIYERAFQSTKAVIPFLSRKRFEETIRRIVHTFKQLSVGEVPDEDIQWVTIGEYADYMSAPHRMDVMVSAMVKDGSWHCNQKCVHCYAAGQNYAEERELTTEQWKRVLDKCREAGIPQITFTGGEPTMREDLCELIAYARWFVSRLNTNGIRLTPEYCEDLRRAELDGLQITLYSGDESIHNTLVGAAQYRNTVAGIKNSLAAGLNPSINTPLCTLNRDYVKTLEFLHALGVTYVTCSSIIVTGRAETETSQSMQLQIPELKQILTEAVDYAFANGMEIGFTSPGWLENDYFRELSIPAPNCGACLSNMAVTPGGNVVPCQSWLSGNVLGNILTDNWEDIWYSAFCKKRREYSSLMLGRCPLRKGRGGI